MKKSTEKKKLFSPYWSDDNLQKGLENGLIKGSLRVNSRNYKEAYVTHSKLDSDILVYDKDINRALYDDIVAVKLHCKYDWKVLNTIGDSDINISSLMNRLSMSNNTNHSVPFVTLRMLLAHSPDFLTEKLGWNMDGVDMTKDEDLPDHCKDWWNYIQRTGYVVSIIHKMNSRFCVGLLTIPENTKIIKFARFIPTDIRYPRLMVSITDCPKDFLKRPLDYKDVKFIAKIGDWSDTDVNPKGHINQCLKNLPLIEQETMTILAECGFEDSAFSDSVLESIPKEAITASDLKYRRDVRSECVFSIDPKTARDLDDALHIRELSPENGMRMWQVGVHIADVSHYITADSPLDTEASKRTTTVYLVHKAVPMLPRKLCEHLCSLHPGSDKLTYSVIYKMTDQCQIVDVWIGRSIMNSACKLSYEDAQTVLDNPDKTDWDQCDFGEIFGSFTANDIAKSILNLNRLAVQMRSKRFDNGSLWINQPKLGFILNDDSTVPLGYTIYKLGVSNQLIEEWMLQANITIAEFIHQHNPQTAFLRCHPTPTAQAIQNINKQFKQMGWEHLQLTTGSTDEFQKLMTVFKRDDANYVIMMNICSKSMQLALYFCNNQDNTVNIDQCHHFALNVPLYTHFTSPIRRYPDVIVHRQITDILMQQQSAQHERGDKFEERMNWMAKTCTSKECTPKLLSYIGDCCNKKKKDAKAAYESSVFLFYSLFVEKSGPFTEQGIVLGLLDKAFDVFLTHCGFIKRVYFDQLDARDSTFNKSNNKLTILWNRTPDCIKQGHPEQSTTLSLLYNVKIIVSALNQGDHSAPKLKLVLANPGCELCVRETVCEPIDITTMQCDVSIIDDERLYNILDDI